MEDELSLPKGRSIGTIASGRNVQLTFLPYFLMQQPFRS